MSDMRLLDLFCGAGGAAMGYHQAGFSEIVGVDIEPQPNYPFRFVQANVLDLRVYGGGSDWAFTDFDLIHASPPCQEHTPMNNRTKAGGWGKVRWPELIEPTRRMLWNTGVPFVIENVTGARPSLQSPMLLTGEMFGLKTSRPRLFELGRWFAMSPPPARRRKGAVAVYGKADGRCVWTRNDGSELRAWSSIEEGQEALGVPWMTEALEIREAIPPAYTRFIGEQFIAQRALELS